MDGGREGGMEKRRKCEGESEMYIENTCNDVGGVV